MSLPVCFQSAQSQRLILVLSAKAHSKTSQNKGRRQWVVSSMQASAGLVSGFEDPELPRLEVDDTCPQVHGNDNLHGCSQFQSSR